VRPRALPGDRSLTALTVTCIGESVAPVLRTGTFDFPCYSRIE
jgi:hypothetical protein